MFPWKIIMWKKACFHIYLEQKKNETVGLYHTSLAQKISRKKVMIIMIIDAISQIRGKTASAT